MSGDRLSALTNLTSLKIREAEVTPSHLTTLTNLTRLRYMVMELPDKFLDCFPKLLKIDRMEGPNTTVHGLDLDQSVWEVVGQE